MKVIFNGVVVTASFSIVDEDGDVVQSIVVQPAQDKVDPLKFAKLTEDNFLNALKALVETREKIKEEVVKQVPEVQ